MDSDFNAWAGRSLVFESELTSGSGPPGWPWYLFRIPKSAAGEYLYLQVHSSNPLTIGPFGGTLAGSRADLTLQTLTKDLEFSLLGLLSVGFGAIALLVFLFQPSLRLYLWFALFTMGEGFVYVSVSKSAFLVWPSAPAWVAVLWIGRAIFPAGILCFFAEVLDDPRRKRIIWIAMTTMGLMLLLIALGIWDYTPFRMAVYWCLIAEFFASMVGVFVVAARPVRRSGTGWGMLLGSAALVLGVYLPNFLRSFGLLVAPETSHRAYGVLMLGMGLVLVRRFVRVHDALSEHAEDLETKNQRLKEVEADLKEAVRGRDVFLSIASHELRSPLAIITNNAHLLVRDPEIRQDEREKAEGIQEQSRHLARIVDDLLDVSRLSHGKLTLRRKPISFDAQVEKALRNLQPDAQAAQLTLHWDGPDAPLWVNADPTRIDQMVGNLVRNAIKFTPAGGNVWVTLKAEGDDAVFTVRDDGPGIPNHVRPHIFELFVQGSLSREEPGDGLGVGLALVKQLAELHGGRIDLEVGERQGTAFALRIPRCAPQPVPAPQPGSVPLPLDRPLRVLLVEDNHNLRFSMRLALKPYGFEVLEAQDGEKGVEQILSAQVDIALVDIAMPKLDGFSVAQRVRASPAGAKVKLVALTGYGQPEDRARAEACGFDRLLVKPVEPDALAQVLREVMAQPGSSQVA